MNQDFTVQKKAIFDRKKNSCRGVHQKKKIRAQAVSEKKKFVQAENSPPPPPSPLITFLMVRPLTELRSAYTKKNYLSLELNKAILQSF